MPLDGSPAAAVLTLDPGQLNAAAHLEVVAATEQVGPVAVVGIAPQTVFDNYFYYLCPSLDQTFADLADGFRPCADSDGGYGHNYQQYKKHVGNYWQNVQIQDIGNKRYDPECNVSVLQHHQSAGTGDSQQGYHGRPADDTDTNV